MRPSPELSVVDLDTARLPGHRVRLAVDQPLRLDCGAELSPIAVAYQTYGQLNQARNNAILVCHALTGDQFAAEEHPITGKDGWWQLMIGPGKTLDTECYFIICANVLGGCMGTTGPIEINPKTGEPYGLSFPVITVGDMVRVQRMLLDHLGIERLFCVTGGSMGGMQVLEWAARYPERVFCAVPIATSARHSAQNIAFHEVGRQAIMADPDWEGGNYLRTGRRPTRGLSVARMAAHITYLSEAALHRKFGRALQDRAGVTYGFDADFQVESYLRYQGISFVDRFDANSYLYITRAMDYFDLAASYDGVLANAFRGSSTRFCVISFTSDWLFPTAESRELVRALTAVAANVSFCEIETDRGHDAFLLEEPEFHRVLAGFLDGAASSGRVALIRAMAAPATLNGLRPDLRLIADLVEANTRVLDVGCGDGALLAFLARTKQVDARGIELSQAGVHECVSRGLAVVQGDADNDLAIFPDASFDYVILSQTIQAMRDPRQVLREHAAHRPLRHRVVHQLCLLARALAAHAAWPHAHAHAACRSHGLPPRTSIHARSRISSSCATSSACASAHRICLAASGEPNRLVLAHLR